MKSTTTFIVLYLLSFLSLLAQDQITEQTYQQAENQLYFHTSQYVDRMNVRANWESDDQLWYRVLQAD